jgi:hypothetical protein
MLEPTQIIDQRVAIIAATVFILVLVVALISVIVNRQDRISILTVSLGLIAFVAILDYTTGHALFRAFFITPSYVEEQTKGTVGQ